MTTDKRDAQAPVRAVRPGAKKFRALPFVELSELAVCMYLMDQHPYAYSKPPTLSSPVLNEDPEDGLQERRHKKKYHQPRPTISSQDLLGLDLDLHSIILTVYGRT